MKVKRSIFNLPMSIIGLTIEQAKISCLVEGYVLRLKDCNIHNFLQIFIKFVKKVSQNHSIGNLLFFFSFNIFL